MRYLTMLALLLLTFGAAAQVYKYTDEKGVIHYTDKPPNKDAKPATLPELQTYTPTSVTPATPPSAPSSAPLPKSKFEVNITSPTPQQTFLEVNPEVAVQVTVMPGLVGDYGLKYYVDDTAVTPEPIKQTSWTVAGLFRGEHKLSVALVDGSGKEVARSSTVVVYMLPPHINR